MTKQVVIDVLPLRGVAEPCEGGPSTPDVAATARQHVEEHPACWHGDVVGARRNLDVLERIEVVVEAGGTDGRGVTHVDAVQIL